MDPDALSDFNERHAKMTGIQQAFAGGDLKAGYVCKYPLDMLCLTDTSAFRN
jgi:hypothetical protein